MYELVNRSTCIVIRNCLLIISAMVLGEMRALNKSWEKLMSGNCCVLIIYIYGCIQTDGSGRVDKLPVVLQSVRLERNVSPFCIYARTTYTETIIDAWWSQGMTIKECISFKRIPTMLHRNLFTKIGWVATVKLFLVNHDFTWLLSPVNTLSKWSYSRGNPLYFKTYRMFKL